MKILINTATTHKGGGVQVAKSFIEECKVYSEHNFIVVLGLGLSQLIDTNQFPDNFTFFKINYRPATRVFSFKDQAKFLKKVENKTQPDVVFTTSGPAYWRPKAPHVMGYNLAHYLYKDSLFFKIISFKEQLFWKTKGRVIKWYTKRDADHYVTQTDDINKRLKAWIHTKNVITVSNTYGSQYDHIQSDYRQQLPEKGEDEYRFLLLSGYYKHKNIEIINEICAQLISIKYDKHIRFVLTLPQNEFHQVIKSEYHHIVYNVGPQKPTNCPGLYKECDAIFLPTLLECFSATYAEAMKMEVPIITTDLGFAHSVCGKAALYFKPGNADDAITQIVKLYQNKTLQAELVVLGKEEMKKFNTAAQRAQKYIAICQQILDKN